MGKRRSRGEGSIFKRTDGLWVGQIRIDGKKKVKYSKVQKEVRDWLHAKRDAVSKGIYIDSKDMTLFAFLAQYKAYQVASLRPRTTNGYIRPHDLRHFAISYLINALHISPAIVQQIVGHASPRLTLSAYTHSSTQQQEEAAHRMRAKK